MQNYIPFLTSEDGGKLAKKVYSDAEIVRLPLDRASKMAPLFNGSGGLLNRWVDAGVDGLDNLKTRTEPWLEFMDQFSNYREIAEVSFQSKPTIPHVEKFVTQILTKCLEFSPMWLTVPQLPVCEGGARNKVNVALAQATAKWRAKSGFRGKLILPLIFVHQSQVNKKSARNPKVEQAAKCYHESQADGIWTVEKSLEDESGSPTLRNVRFPGLIQLHQELNAAISSRIRIAGPYWGINLVLWARNLIDYPAIGVGQGFQYHLSGGQSSTPKSKVAIPSIRRRITATASLKKWLGEVLEMLGNKHPFHAEFAKLVASYPALSTSRDLAREQIARFYREWYLEFASKPADGRSLAIFQDLSAAYAFGRTLPAFEDPKIAKRPEALAESLILSCL